MKIEIVKTERPLSGREASVLALLAQSQSLSAAEKRRILSSLEGQALKIARVIVGQTKRPTKMFVGRTKRSTKAVRAAKGFRAWAKGLSPVGSSLASVRPFADSDVTVEVPSTRGQPVGKRIRTR